MDRVNHWLLTVGVSPRGTDSIGSSLAMAPAEDTAFNLKRAGPDDLERRRSLGQFFTPLDVARFMWDMAEHLRGEKWDRTARIVDPACGKGVFLRQAIERGLNPRECVGVDSDETLVPLWQRDPPIRGARVSRANGLCNNPAVGLTPASFDLVIGNPPFGGHGLRDLTRLLEQPAAKFSHPEPSEIDDEPAAADAPPGNGARSTIDCHERANLSYVAQELSRYTCWRLRDRRRDACDAVSTAGPRIGRFTDDCSSGGRRLRAAGCEEMALAALDWPAGRLLDPRHRAVRDAIRRIGATPIDVYFVERFVRLAKPGGMIAVIVPERILAGDALAPFRNWLMGQIRLLAVIGLPQNVFNGVGARAKTGVVFARKYTDAEREANARASSRTIGQPLSPELGRKKVFMVAPDPALPNWSLQEYLTGIRKVAPHLQANANRIRKVRAKNKYHGCWRETIITLGEMVADNPLRRWNPGYFEGRFVEIERHLRRLEATPLGGFIPNKLPDGSKGITYGQVGARRLSPHGAVRYLQVINIRDTGIDFAIKPDRVLEGTHNDPERSRVRAGDILLTNNAFRDTQTLLGRCVVAAKDYGKVNISQHIDRIRVQGISPYYVCAFLKTKYGRMQIERVTHGVDSAGISFGRIRDILLPGLSSERQSAIEDQYMHMAHCHQRAMCIKERLLEARAIDPGQNGETINALASEKPAYRRAVNEATDRLDHLVTQLEAVIDGRQCDLKPFPHAIDRCKARKGPA
jgi:hypothetical protein